MASARKYTVAEGLTANANVPLRELVVVRTVKNGPRALRARCSITVVRSGLGPVTVPASVVPSPATIVPREAASVSRYGRAVVNVLSAPTVVPEALLATIR